MYYIMEDMAFREFADNLTKIYEERILKKLNNAKDPLYIREHYSESVNFYGNTNIWNMIETLNWLSYSDIEKKEILDNELDEYFT